MSMVNPIMRMVRVSIVPDTCGHAIVIVTMSMSMTVVMSTVVTMSPYLKFLLKLCIIIMEISIKNFRDLSINVFIFFRTRNHDDVRNLSQILFHFRYLCDKLHDHDHSAHDHVRGCSDHVHDHSGRGHSDHDRKDNLFPIRDSGDRISAFSVFREYKPHLRQNHCHVLDE